MPKVYERTYCIAISRSPAGTSGSQSIVRSWSLSSCKQNLTSMNIIPKIIVCHVLPHFFLLCCSKGTCTTPDLSDLWKDRSTATDLFCLCRDIDRSIFAETQTCTTPDLFDLRKERCKATDLFEIPRGTDMHSTWLTRISERAHNCPPFWIYKRFMKKL